MSHAPHSPRDPRDQSGTLHGRDPEHGQEHGQEHSHDPARLPELDEISRRTMLGLMGASLAMGQVACRRPIEHIVPFVEAPEYRIPGVPRHFATTMPLGTEALGVVVESHDGRPTKIEGNEQHPSSGGPASAWMQAAVLGLYDPDRLDAPRRRADRAGSAAGEASGGEHGEAGSEPHGGGARYEDVTWTDVVAFLGERRSAHLEDRGAGLAVVTGSFSSPTLHRVWAQLGEIFPQARRIVWEPAGDANVFAGTARLAGSPLRPVYHLETASTVVTLDADILYGETDAVALARGLGAARRVTTPDDDMCRLFAVESTLTLTGAAADHRVRLASRRIGDFAAALAAALAERGVAVASPPQAPDLPDDAADVVAAIADELASHGARGVVIAGRGQPPAVHAAAHAINAALGAPVDYVAPVDAAWDDGDGPAELMAAITAGEVSTLVVVDANPVYSAPAEFDLAAVLASVEHTIHLTESADETSAHCTWQLPATHFLEAWGDARAIDGSASLIQPLVRPLFGGRSAIEVLGLLADGEEAPGYERVRRIWGGLLGAEPPAGDEFAAGGLSEFERRWRQVLHDGIYADEPPAGAGLAAGAAELAEVWNEIASGSADDGLEVTFRVSAAAHDGRFANNGWLQELPDPVTKITWGDGARISRATAERLGVGSGQFVRVTHRDSQLELPVWVQPGQADDSVSLSLGYGRSAAGRVGDGVGWNAYAVRSAAAPWIAGDVRLEPLDRRYEFARTQGHQVMEGRDLVREATLDDFHHHPDLFHGHGGHHVEDLWPSPADYGQGHQWGMSIDLNSCIGCNACVVACQAENNIPIVGPEQVIKGREMHWIRIDRYYTGDDDAPDVAYQPVPCQHCEKAPCEQVCPVAATVHDDEGLNAMVYNRCVGTRYCSNNCPYKVRRFNFFHLTKATPKLVELGMNPDVTVRSRGVMEKCTYCLQRISEAKIDAKRTGRPLRDGDVRTACQQTCPTEAIVFGDLNDDTSTVVARKKQPRDYSLLGELDTRPRTTYLAKLRNPSPALGGGTSHPAAATEDDQA